MSDFVSLLLCSNPIRLLPVSEGSAGISANLKAPAEKQVLISPPAGIYEFYITIKSVELHPVKKYTNLEKIKIKKP